MSTIVYRDILQSCFESQIIETTTLKLKIPSSIEFGNIKEKCNYQVTKKTSTTTTNLDCGGGGWSSLQNLSNISKESGIYVHPSSKKCSYSSRLSEKSLQLCTESLGSETGTDIIDTNILSFSTSYSRIEKSTSTTSPTTTTTTINDDHMMTSSRNRKVTKRSSSINKKFPPPLTTIRGLNSVQFKPHREDGRLIIKAIEAPLTHNYLQAERSNGRLRLCFYKNEVSATADTSNFDENEELEEFEDDVIENDIVIKEEEEEEEKEEIAENTEEEDTEEKEEESDIYNTKWDMDGNKFDVECEMGKEKCQRLSRCKESGKGNKVFCDWGKTFLVATS